MKLRSVNKVFRRRFRSSVKVYRKMLASKLDVGDEVAKLFVLPLSFASACLMLRRAFGAEPVCHVKARI